MAYTNFKEITEKETLAYIFRRIADHLPATLLKIDLKMKDTTFADMLKRDYALEITQGALKEDKTVWLGRFTYRGKAVSFKRSVSFKK